MLSCFPYVLPSAFFLCMYANWLKSILSLYGADGASLTSCLNTFHHFKSVNKCHKVTRSSQTSLPELLWRFADGVNYQTLTASTALPASQRLSAEQTPGQRSSSEGIKKKARQDWVKWPWMSVNRAAAVKCCTFHSESCGYLSRMWNSVVPLLGFVSIWGQRKKQTSMNLTEDWISN